MVDRENHQRGLLGERSSVVLVNVPGRANRDLFCIVDGLCEEVEEMVVIIWPAVGWDPLNRQLYRGWRLGKRKRGIGAYGAGLVEAAGESIKVRCV